MSNTGRAADITALTEANLLSVLDRMLETCWFEYTRRIFMFFFTPNLAISILFWCLLFYDGNYVISKM